MATDQKNSPRKVRTNEEKNEELHGILEMKAQGWSDREIKKELKLTHQDFNNRLKRIHQSDFFKQQALHTLVETVHRLRWVRQRAMTDYVKYSGEGPNKEKDRNLNIATASFKRVLEVDIALPKVCEQLGWKVDDLAKYLTKEKLNRKLDDMTDDEFFAEYRRAARIE